MCYLKTALIIIYLSTDNDDKIVEIDLKSDKGVDFNSDDEKLKRKFESFSIAIFCLSNSSSLLISFLGKKF
jgi:hypothetical protein